METGDAMTGIGQRNTGLFVPGLADRRRRRVFDRGDPVRR
jgi:hypothetical protein